MSNFLKFSLLLFLTLSTGCSQKLKDHTHDELTEKLSTPSVVEASSEHFSNRIIVDWNPVSGASGYWLYRSDSSNGTYYLVSDLTGTSFIDLSVSRNTNYFYKAKAKNTVISSDFSSTVIGKTKSAIPLPINVTSEIIDYTTIVLSTDATSLIEGYDVSVGTDSNASNLGIISGSETTATLTGASPATSYYFKGRGYKTNTWKTYSFLEKGEYTSPLKVTTPEEPAEAEPNGTIGTATSLTKNVFTRGQLSSITEYDYYSFTLTGTSTVTGTIFLPDNNTSLPEWDFAIVNSSNSILAQVEVKSGFSDVYSELSLTLPSGTYYLVVFNNTTSNLYYSGNQYKVKMNY